MKQVKDNIFTPNIAIIGIGGAGVNALNNIMNMNVNGVKFIIANTDVKSLESSSCQHKIRLGLEITKGLGAGSKPDIGYQAAEESAEEIKEAIKDVDLLFIVAGMGGGTGTGASQVIAQIAKDLGILTLGFVTTPFSFEGKQRMDFAKNGVAGLEKHIDSLVVIANQNLFKVINQNTSMVDAFRIMDTVIHSGVKAISDLIIANGLVNLDFNDIKTVIKDGGKAMVTSVEVTGNDRVTKISDTILNNPLLDENINLLLAKNMLINITGGTNMTLFEVDKIVNSLRDKANQDTYVNFGAIFDENMAESIRVAVVSTGINEDMNMKKDYYKIPEGSITQHNLEDRVTSYNKEASTRMGSYLNKPKLNTTVSEADTTLSNDSLNSKKDKDSYKDDELNQDIEKFKPLPTLTPKDSDNNSSEQYESNTEFSEEQNITGMEALHYANNRFENVQYNNSNSAEEEDVVKHNTKSNKIEEKPSLFKVIEDHKEDVYNDDEDMELNLDNKAEKTRVKESTTKESKSSKASKSFFDLPPFLRHKK